MSVGPATNALSQLTRMSSARSGRMLSSRRLSMASRYSGRYGMSQEPVCLRAVLVCVMTSSCCD